MTPKVTVHRDFLPGHTIPQGPGQLNIHFTKDPAAVDYGGAMEGSDVLLVCTANRCRSPIAAALFTERAIATGLLWSFTGAGTRARPGDETEPEAIEVLREAGVPAKAVPVHNLASALRAGPDLVLTAERRHRTVVLERSPKLIGRVFTMLEIERLLRVADTSADEPTPGAVARLAESARAAAGSGGAEDDLGDPIGKPMDAFRHTLTTLDGVVARVVAAATG